MDPRDRRRTLLLFGLAAGAWVAVAAVLVLVDPLSSTNAGLLGSGVMGLAAGVSAAPLFWLVSFARHQRIAYRGDWLRALRRGAWVGALVAVLIIMRLNGVLQLPIALFLIALAVVAEVTLTAGGANRA